MTNNGICFCGDKSKLYVADPFVLVPDTSNLSLALAKAFFFNDNLLSLFKRTSNFLLTANDKL